MKQRAFIVLVLMASSLAMAADLPTVSFEKAEGSVAILIDGAQVATYVYNDPVTTRPYFCQVKALGGTQVTRIHPPDPLINKGNDDHETFHAGMWLAFGDINSNDYWRNAAQVRHLDFAGPMIAMAGLGRFRVINSYESPGGGPAVCQETCAYTIRATNEGWFLISESEFKSDTANFSFGDQEEMGFGLRINTPLTVEFGGGSILNSDGGLNEKETWGRTADWCMYSGTLQGRHVGAVLMPAPTNFRPCWFHSRDYGLLVANPFGKKAMTGAEDANVAPDATVVPKGETFKLGYGVFIFSTPKQPDPTKAYTEYVKIVSAANS